LINWHSQKVQVFWKGIEIIPPFLFPFQKCIFLLKSLFFFIKA
jgi:hypothetical protein